MTDQAESGAMMGKGEAVFLFHPAHEWFFKGECMHTYRVTWPLLPIFKKSVHVLGDRLETE